MGRFVPPSHGISHGRVGRRKGDGGCGWAGNLQGKVGVAGTKENLSSSGRGCCAASAEPLASLPCGSETAERDWVR